MNLRENWDQIRDVVSRGKRSTGHFAIASVDPEGRPHVTPVGTLFLRDDLTGFYFEQYTSTLAHHLDTNPQVCVMAVDRGSWFWFRSLLAARFTAPPGVRLYGSVGARRPATAAELALVEKSVEPARWLKGGRLLWSDFSHVRDITFTDFRPVRYPVMMSHLWQPTP